MRIGMGYDVHRLVPDRALVMGGVSIPGCCSGLKTFMAWFLRVWRIWLKLNWQD